MDRRLPPVGARREVTVARALDIDRNKLRAALRKLGDEYVFYMLDGAIDLLPPAKLKRIVGKYLDLKQLRAEGGMPPKDNLLDDVKAFERASLAGKYYEPFNVNSQNFMSQFTGTTAWISECRRLVNRCVDQAETADASGVRQAFDIIFGLLDHIDECHEDVIFFADEAGAWQFGVNWEKVLPPWFKVLSATASPDEYASRIVALLKHHYDYGSAKMLALAQKVATPAQRQALSIA